LYLLFLSSVPIPLNAEAEGSSETAKSDYSKYDDKEEVLLSSMAASQQYEKQKKKQEAVSTAGNTSYWIAWIYDRRNGSTSTT
jgi:hypothetical protein